MSHARDSAARIDDRGARTLGLAARILLCRFPHGFERPPSELHRRGKQTNVRLDRLAAKVAECRAPGIGLAGQGAIQLAHGRRLVLDLLQALIDDELREGYILILNRNGGFREPLSGFAATLRSPSRPPRRPVAVS